MPRLVDIRFAPASRRVLAGPVMKKVGTTLVPTKQLLDRMGREVVRQIVREGRKDLAKQGNRRTPVGEPEGIPVDRKFWRSFKHRIKGERTIEIVCRWPWGVQILEGRDDYKMTWLTREKGVKFVPIRQQDGRVVVRMTPEKAKDAWVHPGFASHRFIERGLEKARPKLVSIMAEAAVPHMAAGV